MSQGSYRSGIIYGHLLTVDVLLQMESSQINTHPLNSKTRKVVEANFYILIKWNEIQMQLVDRVYSILSYTGNLRMYKILSYSVR